MHLTLILTAIIISCSTVCSHPLQPSTQSDDDYEFRDEVAPRPLAQFFKKIFSALRPRFSRTTTESPSTTHISIPSSYHSQSSLDVQEIPNFVDFSTYLLDSFANNSAIKFSYLNPNATSLRAGNYSVISFLVPVNTMTKSNATNSDSGGILSNFLNFFRFPWRRDPLPPKPGSDTVYQQFPQFLEYFAQRVQAYFSIYKYADESRFNNTIVLEAIEANDEHKEEVTQNDDFTTTETFENDEQTTTEYEEELTTTESNKDTLT